MANGRDELVIEARGEFKDLLADLDDLQGELDDTAERARKVGAEDIDLDTTEARRKVREIQRDFEEFAREAKDPVLIRARADAAQKEIRELRKDFGELQGAARRAAREVKKIEQGRGSFKALSVEIKGASAALSSFVGNLAARAFERFFDLLRDGIVSLVKTKAELDGLQPALRGVTGGFDGAASSMEFLEGVSDRLARPISELVPGFTKLSAATKNTRVEGDLTRRLFEGLTSTAQALGAGTQQVEGAMLGLSQVAGGPVLRDMENVRQVTDALPGVMAAWASALGVTQEELRKMVESGTKPTEEALEALAVAFENLSGEAVGDRLDTLAGKFAQVDQKAEELGQTFADEIEPGLKAVLDQVLGMSDGAESMAEVFGQVANTTLKDFADALRVNNTLAEEQRGIFSELLEIAPFREVVADALKLTPGLKSVGVALDAIGDSMEGLPKKGSEAFDKLVSGAVLASQGITDATSEAAEGAAQDFLGLSEKASESFRKQAEEAGVSAELIEKIERELAADLVKINDETAKRRETLRSVRVKAERDQVDDLEKVEKELSKAVLGIVEETEEQRAEAIRKRVEDAKAAAVEEEQLAREQERRVGDIAKAAEAAAEKRIATERRAADAVAAEATRSTEAAAAAFDELAEKAGASGDERAAAAAELGDELVEVENDTANKRADILEKFRETIAKGSGDREKLEADLLEKLTDLEADAAQKREALIERRVEAVKKAADEEIKQLERVKKAQEDLAKSLDDLFDESEKASKAGEGGGGDRKLPVEDAVERVREDVEALRSELDGLQFGGEGTGLDPDRILDVGRAYNEATLGVSDFADGSEAARSEYEDATAAMRENATQLGEKIRELVTENEAFAEVFPTLSASAQDAIGRIVAEFGNLDEGAQLSEETVRQVENALRELTGTQEGAGTGAETLAGRLRDLAGEADGVTEASDRSAEAIRGAAEGIEFSGEATEKAREGLERWKDEARDAADEVEGAGEQAADAADGIKAGGEAAAEASEGVGQLSEVAGQAADGVGAVADAATRLSEVELPPELPEQLASIGEAAALTTESAGPLGESLALVTTQLAEIQVSVEALAAAAPELNTLIVEGSESLAALVESENLATLGKQVLELREGLEGVGPLTEQVATSLTTIGEQGEPVAESAELIRDALAELGSEELVGKVQAIVDVLQDLPEPLDKSAESSERVKDNVGELADFADKAKDSLDGLVAIFEESLPAGVKATTDALDEARNAVSGLTKDAQDAARAITEGMTEAREVIQGATQDAQALASALRDAAAAQRELNEATNEANAEEG